MNLDEKMYNPKNVRYKISSAKNELLTPEAYSVYSNTKIDEEVVKIYKKYQEKLLQNNCFYYL